MTKLILLTAFIFLNFSIASAQDLNTEVVEGRVLYQKILLRFTPATAETKSSVEVGEVVSARNQLFFKPAPANRGGGWDPQIGGKFPFDSLTQEQAQLFVDAHSSDNFCNEAAMARLLSTLFNRTSRAADLFIDVRGPMQKQCVQKAIAIALAN